MKLRTVLFAVIALLPLLSCGNGAVSAELDDIESYIHERPDSALAILQACYDEFLSCILVSFSYDLGEVDYELVNLSTSCTAYGTIDSDSGSQVIMMSGLFRM